MNLHLIKYFSKTLIRNKQQLLWLIIFPIALGTLFKVAFSNLMTTEKFQSIPVAVVCSDTEFSTTFKEVVAEVSTGGDEQLLEAVFCSKEEALDLLKEAKIDGIIYTDTAASLSISSSMKSQKLNQSILKTFVDQVNINFDAVHKIIETHPENLSALFDFTNVETSYNEEISLMKKDTDISTQYFYNLIAMTCLYTGLAGLLIAIHNQANLSSLGARKNVSPLSKQTVIINELVTNIVFQFLCVLVGFAYLVFVLQIDLTYKLPFTILTIFAGCTLGVNMGYFIGSFGNMSQNNKTGILFSFTMACCFLSGLMVGNMRIIIDDFCPWLNHINPTALIADSFYSLFMFDSLHRYFGNLIMIIILSILFAVGGFLLTRRKKYASL